jgi:alkyl hydroperoxide reductase subunit AhpF
MYLSIVGISLESYPPPEYLNTLEGTSLSSKEVVEMKMDISKLKDEEIDQLISFLDRRNISSFIKRNGEKLLLICSSTPIGHTNVELGIENI